MTASPDFSSYTVFSRGPESSIQVTHSETSDGTQTTHTWKTVPHPSFKACITLTRSKENAAHFFGTCSLEEQEEGGSAKSVERVVHATFSDNQISVIPQEYARPITWSLKKEELVR